MKLIKDLKKNDKFKLNDIVYTVVRKFTKYKNEEPYLKTECGQFFYHDELEVELI